MPMLVEAGRHRASREVAERDGADHVVVYPGWI